MTKWDPKAPMPDGDDDNPVRDFVTLVGAIIIVWVICRAILSLAQ